MSESLSIRLSHVVRYINAMVPKDKKTMQDNYPVEMSEAQKNYIVNHLQFILDEIKSPYWFR